MLIPLIDPRTIFLCPSRSSAGILPIRCTRAEKRCQSLARDCGVRTILGELLCMPEAHAASGLVEARDMDAAVL